MKGSQFVAEFRGKGPAAWERAVVEMARSGQGLVEWPLVPIVLSDGTNEVVFRAASDYLAVGEPDDYIRLPMTPRAAQEVANLRGRTLPTPLMEYAIWRASSIKLERRGMSPNRGMNLDQFAEHSRLVDQQLAGRSGLSSGSKKDVVVSKLLKPGVVIIEGWRHPRLDVFKDNRAWDDPSPEKQPQQNESDAHGDNYGDYSHGIREIDDQVTVNGQSIPIDNALRDPIVAKFLSHQGPLSVTRYNAPRPEHPVRPHVPQAFAILDTSFPRAYPYGPADVGLAELMRRQGYKGGGGT